MAGKLPPVELTVQSQNNNCLVLNSFTLGTICVCVRERVSERCKNRNSGYLKG